MKKEKKINIVWIMFKKPIVQFFQWLLLLPAIILTFLTIGQNLVIIFLNQKTREIDKQLKDNINDKEITKSLNKKKLKLRWAKIGISCALFGIPYVGKWLQDGVNWLARKTTSYKDMLENK